LLWDDKYPKKPAYAAVQYRPGCASDSASKNAVSSIAEETEDGIVVRPAIVVPVERYTPERKAEFLLSNAVDDADYRKARKAVQKLSLDPDSIPRRRPA
jgi:hypothetical protein